MTQSEKTTYIIRTAKDSKGNSKLWLRYIAKQFEADKTLLTQSELNYLLSCDELTVLQKCLLKSAYQTGSETNRYVIKLGQRCDTSFVDSLLEGRKGDSDE